MMCYRDMTFCTFYKDCTSADTCHRPLTDEVKAQAVEFWGSEDVPIACFTDRPDCFVEVSE